MPILGYSVGLEVYIFFSLHQQLYFLYVRGAIILDVGVYLHGSVGRAQDLGSKDC